ncbi:Uncharacterised protein [Shigella sonnei]|nr:Uncharacterised protein [Shigella sonnei]
MADKRNVVTISKRHTIAPIKYAGFYCRRTLFRCDFLQRIAGKQLHLYTLPTGNLRRHWQNPIKHRRITG